MSRLLLLFARIFKKIGISRHVFNILKRLVGNKSFCPVDGWMEYLNNISPDQGGSCVWDNKIMVRDNFVDLEIIIPVYNTVQYISECIESALNQKTQYSYNIIIVDDGSSDGSSDIIDKYADDPRIRVIRQKNRGFSGARNRALEMISGRYVTFLDSDDRLSENAVELLLSKSYEGDYDIVGGGYVRFDKSKHIRKVVPSPGQLFGFACGKVYKAHLWANVRFPENYWFEDTLSALILHDMAKRTTCIQDTIYEYRVNRESISFRSIGNPKSIDSLWVTLRLLKDRESLGISFDNKFLDQLVNQFKVNTKRIATLGDRQANVANFQASREIYFRYCKGHRCQITSNIQIESAILNDDYWRFLLGCLFL